MSSPVVLVQAPDGQEVLLYPGDLIGRLPSAALCIQDPRISEVHAYISLRGSELRLINLQGRFDVEGQQRRSLALEVGRRIQLAEGVKLQVLEVQLPNAVLGLRCDGSAPIPLSGDQASLTLEPLGVTMRFLPEAPARLWRSGEAWLLQVGLALPREVLPGASWQVGAHRFEAALISIEAASSPDTQTVRHPLTIRRSAKKEHRVIALAEREIDIGGMPARVLYELLQSRQGDHWKVLAESIWKQSAQSTEKHLRDKWDINVRRLRRWLKEEASREDLIASDNTGHYRLKIQPGDTIEDWEG